MQQSTRFCTRLRIEASITPQADEVERSTICLVAKSSCKGPCIDWYNLTKSLLRWPIIGVAKAASVLGETSTGPGMKSFVCERVVMMRWGVTLASNRRAKKRNFFREATYGVFPCDQRKCASRNCERRASDSVRSSPPASPICS